MKLGSLEGDELRHKSLHLADSERKLRGSHQEDATLLPQQEEDFLLTQQQRSQ